MAAALWEHLTLPVTHWQTLHTSAGAAIEVGLLPLELISKYRHGERSTASQICTKLRFGIGNCFRRSDPAAVINGCDQVLRQNKHSKALIKGNRCMGYRFMSPVTAQ